MSREIKFRAWDKFRKEMTDGPYEGDFIKWHAPSNWKECYEIMQYTGLHDKNGKEIYEGDIIKSIRGYKAIVEWADDGRFLGFTLERERKIMYVGQEPAVEVMGNIHDNPELIKEPTT